MKHVVVTESHICPKCLKENVGSAESILDLLICPKCAEMYRKDLMPKIEIQVREFFQPERSKREDVGIFVLKSENYDGPRVIDYKPSKECDEYHKNSVIQVNLRSGALNTMET